MPIYSANVTLAVKVEAANQEDANALADKLMIRAWGNMALGRNDIHDVRSVISRREYLLKPGDEDVRDLQRITDVAPHSASRKQSARTRREKVS